MYDLQLTNWCLTYTKTSEKQNYKLFMKKNMFRYITNAANIKRIFPRNVYRKSGKVFRMVSVGSFLRISLTSLEANLNFVRLDSLTFQAT